MGSSNDLDETITQIQEVIGDFRRFCYLLNIRTKEGGNVTFDYDGWWEEQKLFNKDRNGRDIVVKPRQIGFSTLELARDLHFAIINPGAQVLVVCHDHEIKNQLYLTIRIMADGLKQLGLLPKTRYSTKTELVFKDTGSAVRIVEAGETEKAASKKGRSGTIHRLHVTEVAFWGSPAETMKAILGSVTDDGEVVIESTPNGAGGLFYNDVQAALIEDSEYKLHFFPWYNHSKYRKKPPENFDPTPEDKWEKKLRELGCDDWQIAWWRSKTHDPKFGLESALQEYPIDIHTCFRSPEGAYFSAEVLDSISVHITESKRKASIKFKEQNLGELLIYEEPDRKKQYVIFGDVAEGVGADASSAHVLERKTGRTVATYWSDTIEPGDFGLVLSVIGWLYNTALVAPERNNHGHATIRAMKKEAKYRRIFRHNDKKHGWVTNAATRPPMWDELAMAIREGSAFTPDAQTLAECRTIIKDDDGKPRARNKSKKDGCKDDRYVSWAGAWQLRSMPVQETRGIHLKNL